MNCLCVYLCGFMYSVDFFSPLKISTHDFMCGVPNKKLIIHLGEAVGV